jgi:glutamate carboxypeptidase
MGIFYANLMGGECMTDKFNFSELASIIEINSFTKNKAGVDINANIYSEWMRALGYNVQVHERSEIGNHVHYVSPKKAGKKVLLLGHFDTVFPPDTFELFREDEEWIYGPGVCDMKGGNYIALQALRNVKAMQGDICNIDVLMVSDEETGSDDSKHLTMDIAKHYDACFVFEAAGPDDNVVIARKGIATFTLNITGKAAHSGNYYVDGINANLAAAHLLISLTALTDLAAGTTVNAGKMHGGIGANTISPSASLVVEARFSQTSERDRILTAFQTISELPAHGGATVQLTGGLQRDVMQPSDQQTALLEALAVILGSPLQTEKRGGVSDANVASAAGVPTLDGFGPYGDGDHTIDERARKSSFISRTADVTKILSAFNGK